MASHPQLEEFRAAWPTVPDRFLPAMAAGLSKAEEYFAGERLYRRDRDLWVIIRPDGLRSRMAMRAETVGLLVKLGAQRGDAESTLAAWTSTVACTLVLVDQASGAVWIDHAVHGGLSRGGAA